MFRKFHGITLAEGSSIENLNLESLAADPSPVSAGRLWFNNTEKLIKYSTLDSEGTVVVTAIVDADQLTEALSQLDTDVRSYTDTSIAGIQSQVDALGNAFNYVGALPGQSGVTGTGTEGDPYVLDGMNPGFKDAGDYYKITAGGVFEFNGSTITVDVNDGLVFNTAGGLDRINNQNSQVEGTADEIDVTGSVETGFTVKLARAIKDSIAYNATDIADETSRAQSAESVLDGKITQEASDRAAGDSAVQANVDAEVTRAQAEEARIEGKVDQEATDRAAAVAGVQSAVDAEVTRAQAAETANADAIAAEVARAQAAEAANADAIDVEATRARLTEGNLGELNTDAKTSLVDAINEVVAEAGGGAEALKTSINNKRKIYTATSAATNHSFNHNFTGEDLIVSVMVKDEASGKWYNDSVLVELDPVAKSVTVPLQEAAIIKIIVEDATDLA